MNIAPGIAMQLFRWGRGAAFLCSFSVLFSACAPSDSEQASTAAPNSAVIATPSTGCPSDAEIDRYLADWRARQPTMPLAEGGTLDDALCAQAKIVERHMATLGEPVGYKAGLTSEPSQQTFGVTEPVRGVLLEGMLLPDSSEVPADFGARPRYEADMIVVVGDAAINQATTIEEVHSHLTEIIPFIELPDLAVAEGETLDGVVLTAINVASRMGVVGDPVPVQRTPEFLQALADMNVSLVDQSGEVLQEASGAAILGHPLNSVLWLIENGVQFEVGDYVSVGSFGALLIPEAGLTATVRYEGLPGDPMATVRFR